MERYILPQFGLDAYNCPHCGAFSRQIWSHKIVHITNSQLNSNTTLTQVQHNIRSNNLNNMSISFCERCGKYVIWHNDNIIYPYKTLAPRPADDMPKEILNDYLEASGVLDKSPKSAAALLRLVIQKLCVIIGGKGKNIDEDIKFLVSNGLPIRIQKALDIVRVVGNNAVHPGTIDLNDNPEIALSLFNLVNIIIETMITQPKELDKLYNSLPQNQLDHIKERDTKK